MRTLAGEEVLPGKDASSLIPEFISKDSCEKKNRKDVEIQSNCVRQLFAVPEKRPCESAKRTLEVTEGKATGAQ